MTSPSFTFGAGANHVFAGVDTETKYPPETTPATTKEQEQEQEPASIEELHQQELAERMEDINALRMQLAEARATNGDLNAKLAFAERACTSAQCTEKVARSALDAFREQTNVHNRKMNEREYNLVADFEAEKDQLKATIEDQRKAARELQGELDNIKAYLHSSEQQVTDKEKELVSLYDSIEKLKRDVEDEKAATANSVQSLEKAYADLTQADHARKTAVKARDEAVALQHDTQLQFDDLHKQWAEAQSQIEELQKQAEAIQDLEKENAGLLDDMDGLHEQLRDHERTLIVKDERIGHLETQFQKERQRNLNAADAAAAAAAASPTDEPPQAFSSLDDSLEAELAATDDYDESIYEPLDFSHVTEVVAFTPIAPAIAQSLSIAVGEAASFAPIITAAPTFAVNVTEAASVTPIEREITTSTSYTQTDAHELTIEIPQHAALDVTPVAPVESTPATTSKQKVPVKLTTTIIDSATIDFPPIDVQQTERMPTATTAAQTAISNPKITLTPMIVTHEEWPLEEIVPLRPTASAAVQTMEIEQAAEPATDTSPPVILSPKPKTSGVLDKFLLFFAVLFGIACIMLYTQLQAWKTANGIGLRHNMYNRGGAYGNGRYLFGYIPIAMDVGNSWWSERVAQSMSVAITQFENWAGITYKPLY